MNTDGVYTFPASDTYGTYVLITDIIFIGMGRDVPQNMLLLPVFLYPISLSCKVMRNYVKGKW